MQIIQYWALDIQVLQDLKKKVGGVAEGSQSPLGGGPIETWSGWGPQPNFREMLFMCFIVFLHIVKDSVRLLNIIVWSALFSGQMYWQQAPLKSVSELLYLV